MMNRRFLSTLSLRRATTQTQKHLISQTISIHALLAESDFVRCRFWVLSNISIHALLAESDQVKKYSGLNFARISIHALLAESDLRLMSFWLCGRLFLSTLSLRRATQVFQRIAKPFRISIHALLAESDPSSGTLRNTHKNFYPRSPCGERRICTATLPVKV